MAIESRIARILRIMVVSPFLEAAPVGGPIRGRSHPDAARECGEGYASVRACLLPQHGLADGLGGRPGLASGMYGERFPGRYYRRIHRRRQRVVGKRQL